MKISIVIPLFNEAPQLARIAKSIQSQSHSNFEAIFVNDASTDNSVSEIRRLQESDRRIVLANLPHNRGGGTPYNAGIDQSSGDYVFIMDADDQLVDENSLAHLAAIAQKTKDDIVFGSTLSLSRTTEEFTRKSERSVSIKQLPSLVYNHSVWNKLYKREFLRESGIRFREGKFAHDILFSAETNIAARTISVSRRETYFYSTGRQIARASPKKVIDARENAGIALGMFLGVGDETLSTAAYKKTLEDAYYTLARAERALSENALLEHLARWSELLAEVPQQVLELLPSTLNQFHLNLRNNQPDEALSTWRMSHGIKRKIRQSIFELLHPQLNRPDRAKLIRLVKQLSRPLS